MNALRLFVLSTITGALAIAVSGCNKPSAGETPSGTKAPNSAAVDRVAAGAIERGSLALHTSQPGRIEAFEETPLYSKVAGYVEELLVDIGDVVTKGQPLVRLRIPEMNDDLEQKEALVAQAEAEVEQAKAAVVAAKAAANTAEARVAQAQAGIGRTDGENERWKAEHSRIKELAAKGVVTQKLADETLNQTRATEAARQEATANVKAAEAALIEAQARTRKAEADQAASESRLRVAKANHSQSKTMLGYTQIRAPFDGVVAGRWVDTGHYVHPAAAGGSNKPLLIVARTDKVRVFVDIPEAEAPLVDGGANGDPAVVRVQSLGGREFNGLVTRTSWSLDQSNRSLRTEIDISNSEGLFRPGMYALVTIRLDERSNVLTLPIAAVVREGQQAFCCCVNSGKIERVPIELGLRSGDKVEVVSGLTGSETVVLARADSLRQGQPVEVITPGK